jgi:hypothetical protein
MRLHLSRFIKLLLPTCESTEGQILTLDSPTGTVRKDRYSNCFLHSKGLSSNHHFKCSHVLVVRLEAQRLPLKTLHGCNLKHPPTHGEMHILEAVRHGTVQRKWTPQVGCIYSGAPCQDKLKNSRLHRGR